MPLESSTCTLAAVLQGPQIQTVAFCSIVQAVHFEAGYFHPSNVRAAEATCGLKGREDYLAKNKTVARLDAAIFLPGA